MPFPCASVRLSCALPLCLPLYAWLPCAPCPVPPSYAFLKSPLSPFVPALPPVVVQESDDPDPGEISLNHNGVGAGMGPIGGDAFEMMAAWYWRAAREGAARGGAAREGAAFPDHRT